MNKLMCITLLGTVLVGTVSTGCKKEEPDKSKMIARVWKAQKVIDAVSGNDITAPYVSQTWEFTEGGTVTLANSSGSTSGSWSFNSDQTKVNLVMPVTYTYSIIKLSCAEFWYTDDTGDEFHLVPN